MRQRVVPTDASNSQLARAYQRASLILLVAGATAVKLADMNRSILITGWVFLCFGTVVGVVGVWRILVMRRAINSRDG